jgi:predicted GIY-YIG superfamily endonuclease
MSTTNIYILKLQGGRYYIGKSDNVLKRYEQHLNGNGSSWTKKYKPISVDKIIPNASAFDEDKYTKEYMSKYGMDKVRGGSYVNVELDEFQKQSINTEIWGAKDLCTQCGRAGHFVKYCYATKDVSGNAIYEEEESSEEEEEYEVVYGCEYCDRTFTTEFGCRVHEKSCKSVDTKKEGACYRCGRGGHYSPECYASRHVKGYSLG